MPSLYGVLALSNCYKSTCYDTIDIGSHGVTGVVHWLFTCNYNYLYAIKLQICGCSSCKYIAKTVGGDDLAIAYIYQAANLTRKKSTKQTHIMPGTMQIGKSQSLYQCRATWAMSLNIEASDGPYETVV